MFAAAGTHDTMKRQVVSQHTHTVCYSDCRRHRAPSVDRGLFLLQPGCAAVGGAGAAWAGPPSALQLHPFAMTMAAHEQQTHTDVTAARHLPRHKAWSVGGRRLVTPRNSRTASLVFLYCTRTATQPPASTTAANPNTSGFTITTHELKLCVAA